MPYSPPPPPPKRCHDTLKLVAHLAIGVERLLAVAFHLGRIRRRPIFHIGRERAGQFQRLVMRLRRERDDEIEVEPFQVLQFLEGVRLVLADIEPDFLHRRDGEGIEVALAARRPSRQRRSCPIRCLNRARRHRRAHRIQSAGEQHELRPASPAIALQPFPMQHADQREQPPRGVEIDLHLVLEPVHQDAGAFVVQAAPAHVDRFDPVRRRGADRLRNSCRRS